MYKKIALVTSLVLATVMIFTGCSLGHDSEQATDETNTEQSKQITAKKLTNAIAKQPILLTSVGQSEDVEMIKVMLDKAGLSYTKKNLANADDLGDNKTLLLSIGGSTKGLGSAGITSEEEISRVEALIKAAKDKGITIVVTHIGGESRRGELSDKFIYPTVPKSDYLVLVADGDKDDLMTNMAIENDIPVASVESMAEITDALKNAFE